MHSAASEQETSSWLVSDGSERTGAVAPGRSLSPVRADPDRGQRPLLSGRQLRRRASCSGVSMSKMIGAIRSTIWSSPASFATRTKNDVLPGRHVVLLAMTNRERRGLCAPVTGCRRPGLLPGTPEPSAFTATKAKRSSVNMPAASIWRTTSLRTIDRPLRRTEGWHKRQDGSRFWANVVDHRSARREPGTAGIRASGARL